MGPSMDYYENPYDNIPLKQFPRDPPKEELEKDAEDPKPKRELKVGDRATYWGPYTPWRDCELTIMDVGRYGRVTANMDDGMRVIANSNEVKLVEPKKTWIKDIPEPKVGMKLRCEKSGEGRIQGKIYCIAHVGSLVSITTDDRYTWGTWLYWQLRNKFTLASEPSKLVLKERPITVDDVPVPGMKLKYVNTACRGNSHTVGKIYVVTKDHHIKTDTGGLEIMGRTHSDGTFKFMVTDRDKYVIVEEPTSSDKPITMDIEFRIEE